MVDKKNIIKLSHSTILLRDDGIVQVDFNKKVEINLAVCKELIDSYSKILEDKKYPILHIIADYVDVTKEAREFSASKRGLKYSAAEAYVFNSLPHRILANFYIKINRPLVPTKFFKTQQEAVAWLLNFK